VRACAAEIPYPGVLRLSYDGLVEKARRPFMERAMNTNELADKIESFGKSGAVVEQAVLLEAARQLRQLADAPKAVTQLLTQLDGEGTRLQQAREETESLRSELTRWQKRLRRVQRHT